MSYILMPDGNLNEISERPKNCHAVLESLVAMNECGRLSGRALAGAADLLGHVCTDFQVDIESSNEVEAPVAETQPGASRMAYARSGH